mgnify:CR=1 FL=1
MDVGIGCIRGGKKVSEEEAADILAKVDTNNDGELSFEEFQAIFELAPDLLPPRVKSIVDVSVSISSSLFSMVGTLLSFCSLIFSSLLC